MKSKTEIFKTIEEKAQYVTFKPLSEWVSFELDTIVIEPVTITNLEKKIGCELWLSNDSDDSVISKLTLVYVSYDGCLAIQPEGFDESFLEVPWGGDGVTSEDVWLVWEKLIG